MGITGDKSLTDEASPEGKLGLEIQRLRLGKVQLSRLMYQLAESLASALEKRNPYTTGHQERVTKLSLAIAREMKLDEDVQAGIRLASTLQNIGMLNVPTDVLSKQGKLNELEYDLIKTHPEVGNKILEGVDFPQPVAEIIKQHHERLNGSGYPRGLKGDDILMEARILAVADVVEAMSSQRFHRPSMGMDKAIEEITKNRAILYDATVVDALLKLYNEGKLSVSE
jgi:HD-GYP domain-containing protein (c-di-GMP phosphodiesterase class II)